MQRKNRGGERERKERGVRTEDGGGKGEKEEIWKEGGMKGKKEERKKEERKEVGGRDAEISEGK